MHMPHVTGILPFSLCNNGFFVGGSAQGSGDCVRLLFYCLHLHNKYLSFSGLLKF